MPVFGCWQAIATAIEVAALGHTPLLTRWPEPVSIVSTDWQKDFDPARAKRRLYRRFWLAYS